MIAAVVALLAGAILGWWARGLSHTEPPPQAPPQPRPYCPLGHELSQDAPRCPVCGVEVESR